MPEMKLIDIVCISLKIKKYKLKEFVRFNSKLASILLLSLYVFYDLFQYLSRNKFRRIAVLGKIFRHINFSWARKFSTIALGKIIGRYGYYEVGKNILELNTVHPNTINKLKISIKNALKPFDKRLIILSPPINGKKGVLLVKFNQYFRYLSYIFDLTRLGKDYLLVLEPSGAGYFDEDILCLMGQKILVVVQAAEPVDHEFINKLDCNFIPIPLGANCWVDNRTFFPINGVKKEYDIILVSIWAAFKRHYHLFEALSKCKSKETRKIALVGRPYPLTLDYIKKQAKYFNVDHCIDFFEDIPQNEINLLMNKSKAYLLLSKKEGFNKGIIESMYANVPGFLLSGFNYGYHYPYINSETGGFIVPSKLTDFIDNIDNIIQDGEFSPASWVASHMSAKLSTAKLTELFGKIERSKNIRINKNLQLKINNPDCDYMDQSLWDKYSEYYKNLMNYFK